MFTKSGMLTNNISGETYALDEVIPSDENQSFKRYRETGWSIMYKEIYDNTVSELNGKRKYQIFVALRDMARYNFDTNMFGFIMPSQRTLANDLGPTQSYVSKTIKIMQATNFLRLEGHMAYINPFAYMSNVGSKQQAECQEEWTKRYRFNKCL